MSENGSGNSKSLVAKLAEVMAAVERIPKNGWNDHFKYKYATEADVADHVRMLFAERHLVMTPDVLSVDTSGKFVLINVAWTIRDGESNETLTFHIPGAGQDTGEKGVYKAITGSQKYALMKLLHIPTGDDPEREDKRDVPERRKRETSASPAPAGATKIADVTHRTGVSKTNKPWQQWTVEFEDGRKASTFQQSMAGLAQRIHAAGVLVTPGIESPDGRNQNLVALETDGEVPAGGGEPPFEFEGVAPAAGGPTEADRPGLMKKVKALGLARKLTDDEKKILGKSELDGDPLAEVAVGKLVAFVEFLEDVEAVAAWRAVQAKKEAQPA